MSTSPFVRSGRFVFLFALLAVLASVPGLAGEIQWKSGIRSAPATMQPDVMRQTMVELAGRPDSSRVVIHFDGPVSLENRAALEAAGVRLLNYLGSYAYFAALTPGLDAVRAATVPGTVSVESIDARNKLHPELAEGIVHSWAEVPPAAAALVPGSGTVVAVNAMFHRDFDLDQAELVLGRYDALLQSRVTAINTVVAHLPMDRVADLAADDAVMWVEPPLPMLQELNDSNRSRVGADTVNAAPYDLDGTGVNVMVYDGGKVFNHADLAGRLTIGPTDTSGTSDHATHVACTVAGDGGSNSGMAPEANIISYGFQVPGGLGAGFLYTDPGDIQADYSAAINDFDAHLSNNSIGSNVAPNGFPCSWEGNYGATGALIDEIARGTVTGEPFRIVWSNGNERGNGSCGTTYGTTPPPACAKNHMTVGALNSNNDSVTGFTSWGPCDDGRLKPDISGPGCQSNGDGGVTSCANGGGYSVKCGTSMSGPTVAGVAALVLQQYRESYPALPDFRNSLLRAIMAQTAVDLGNPGPDYQTGYGSVRAQPAVDLIIDGHFVEDSVLQGQTYTFQLNNTSQGEVEVTLAWDDPAGTPDVNPVLVNDLDLRIVGPDSTVYHPWTLDPGNPGDPAVQTGKDGTNNIEQVRIPNAPAGSYTVEITGFNIAEGPTQTFGVAASHEPLFCTEVPTFAGLLTAEPGDSCGEIDLNWAAGASNCTPAGDLSYSVYRSTASSFTPSPSTLVQQVTGTSTTDVALIPGETYYYVVRAKDSNSGEEDANSAEQSATSPLSPDNSPPVFSGLSSATPGPECGEVWLDWAPALETCSGPVRYEIHRSALPFFIPNNNTKIGTTFSTSFVDTSNTPGAQRTYVVRAVDALGNIELNQTKRIVTPSAFDVEMFSTAFEPDNAGWSAVAPNDASEGNWAWGNPTGTSYQPEDDATEGGVNCWITGLAGGASNGDVDGGTTTLLSAQYDMSGMVNPTVQYQRWFTNDQGGSPNDPTDHLIVEVSNDDGANWTEIEDVGGGTPLQWQPVSIEIPIAATDEMRFRFQTADLGTGSLVEAGIDDFALVDGGQLCNQCPAPPVSTLCEIAVGVSGDDLFIDWSANPVTTRAVVYQVPTCDPGDMIKLGSSDTNVFVHEDALLSEAYFQYRVTFVDECGNEVAFCAPTSCP